MKTKIFIIIALLATLLIIVNTSYQSKKPVDFGPPLPLVINSQAGELNFMVEIADTKQKRRRGLMHREEIANNAGMLFLYDDMRPRTFWMKNTPQSLDILFIDAAGKIVKIEHALKALDKQPIQSDMPVQAVLEIKAGLAKKLGINIGDKIKYPGQE